MTCSHSILYFVIGSLQSVSGGEKLSLRSLGAEAITLLTEAEETSTLTDEGIIIQVKGGQNL